jgi:hypothetical protein
MSDDPKDRVRKAMENYYKRNEPREQRRNNKPEAVIETSIYEKLIELGWSVDYYESSTFGLTNQYSQDYKVRPGHSDLGGNLPNGIACWIECKDKGKRSNLSDNQRQFLIEKISTNCFAIVADSIESVLDQYNQWLNCENKKAYLLKSIPIKKERADSLVNPFDGLD